MALVYKLKITSLSKQESFKLSEDQDLNNVVTSVKFYLEGSEIDGDDIFSARHDGVCPLLVPTVEDFIEYEDLTEDLIKTAIEALYPIEQVKMDIVKEIENKKNPITNETVLPWGEE